MKFKYMHTIDGEPARYNKGEQICYLNNYGKFIGKLVDSLHQIRKEQKLSNKWREEQGCSLIFDYGYVRVEIN